MVRRFPGGIVVGQNATDPLGLIPKQQLDAAVATASIGTRQVDARYPALTTWRTAVAGRATAPADILCIGDSITEGIGATTRAQRWVERLRDLLRQQYPTTGVAGGEGFIAASTYTTPTPPWGWTYAGNQAQAGAYGYGQRNIALGSGSPGGSMTRTVSGTSVQVFYTRASTGGSFAVYLDGSGTAAATVDTAVGAGGSPDDGGRSAVIPLGTRGTHTVKVAWVTGGSTYIGGLMVFDQDEAAGIRLTEAGQSGSSSASWSQSVTVVVAAMTANLVATDPDLVIISLGPNDLLQDRDPATYKTNLQTLITQVRAAKPGVAILLLMAYEITLTHAYTWSAYLAKAREIVAADSATAMLDLSAYLPSTDTGNASYGLLYDGLHPSDIGHDVIARRVADYLIGNVQPGRQITAGPGLTGGGDLSADRTLRQHPALVDELWTDWSTKSDGALPATGDEGVPITVAKDSGGTADPTISGGGVVLTGIGAIYVNQALPSGKKTRRLGATFTFPASGTTSGEAMALCAWLNVAISPQSAHIHVAIGRANWAVQTYNAGTPVTIKSGGFFPSLDLNVEHRAEVTVYGNTMRVELPDGTYVEATDATVGTITGLIGCWEIVQTSTSATVKIVRSWADARPDRPGAPSETSIGQKARRAFGNLYYDDTTGHLGISSTAAAWADLYTPNLIGAGDFYVVNAAPTLANHATRKDYVDTQVATRAAALAPISAIKTASYTLTDADEVVYFNTTSGALIATLPTAVGRTGKRFTIGKSAGANLLTIATTSSQKFDGVATTIPVINAGVTRQVISDGADWWILGGLTEVSTRAEVNPNNVLSRWGLVAANALPTQFTGSSTYAISFYSLQRVFVPAGVAITGVSVIVRTASGVTASTGQTGFAIYEITNGTTATLVTSTTTDATLLGTTGFRRKALNATVAAQTVDREVFVGVACSVTATAPALAVTGIGGPGTKVDGTALYMAAYTGSALSSWTSTITYTSMTNDTSAAFVGLY